MMFRGRSGSLVGVSASIHRCRVESSPAPLRNSVLKGCRFMAVWNNSWAKMAHFRSMLRTSMCDRLSQSVARRGKNEFFALDHGLRGIRKEENRVVTTGRGSS